MENFHHLAQALLNKKSKKQQFNLEGGLKNEKISHYFGKRYVGCGDNLSRVCRRIRKGKRARDDW
jgi:hypothetical protein